MATIRCGGHTFPSIEAVLFDKDGTLADVEGYLQQLGYDRVHKLCDRSNGPLLDNGAFLLSAFGLVDGKLDPAGLLAVGSRQENEVAAAACLAADGWPWIAALTAAKAAFCEAERSLAPKAKKTPLIAGAAALIARLKDLQLKVGIVSADLHREVEAFITHHELSRIDWVWGAGDGHMPKTHPEFLRFACCEVGGEQPVAPQSVLVIGDSASDLGVAEQGAAGFVAMMGGWSTSPTIDVEGAECAIAPISHLDQVEVFA
ncbi:MAG: HAD family hydrolase [Cyanobacteria bacterium J06643_4]